MDPLTKFWKSIPVDLREKILTEKSKLDKKEVLGEIHSASIQFMKKRIQQLDRDYERAENEYRERKYQGATQVQLNRILARQRTIAEKHQEYSNLLMKSS